MSAPPPPPPRSRLPKACLGHIFSFLALKDVAFCTRVSKEWNSAVLASSNRVDDVSIEHRTFGKMCASPLRVLIRSIWCVQGTWSLQQLDAFPRLERFQASELPRESSSPALAQRKRSFEQPLPKAEFNHLSMANAPEAVTTFVRLVQAYNGINEIHLSIRMHSFHPDLQHLDALHTLTVYPSDYSSECKLTDADVQFIWSLKQLKSLWFCYGFTDHIVKKVFAAGHPFTSPDFQLEYVIDEKLSPDLYPLLPGCLKFGGIHRTVLGKLPAERVTQMEFKCRYDEDDYGERVNLDHDDDPDGVHASEDCAQLCRFKELTVLAVEYTNYTSAQLNIVLGCMPKLTTLHLLDASKLGSLAFLRAVPQLTELHLSGHDSAIPQSEAVHVKALKNLKTVQLRDIFVSFEALLCAELGPHCDASMEWF